MDKPERLPTDTQLHFYPVFESEGTGIIWTDDYSNLKKETRDFVLDNFKEQPIPNHLSNMANLSEDDAEELREAVMEAVTSWLESELPGQIEGVIRSVCEEMLNPTCARALRAEIERNLRPKITNEIEAEVRAALKGDIENIRSKVLAEEYDSTKAQIRAELIPEVRNELIEQMRRRLIEDSDRI